MFVDRINRRWKVFVQFMRNWKYRGINYAFSQTSIDPTEILPMILLPKPANWRNFIRFQKVGILTACDIAQPLDKSIDLGHTTGIVINKDAKIGKNVQLTQNVTIGGGSVEGAPVIERDVQIGASAVILGGITVGEGAIIGANATVVSDIPPHSVAVGTPAEVIRYLDGSEK